MAERFKFNDEEENIDESKIEIHHEENEELPKKKRKKQKQQKQLKTVLKV